MPQQGGLSLKLIYCLVIALDNDLNKLNEYPYIQIAALFYLLLL